MKKPIILLILVVLFTTTLSGCFSPSSTDNGKGDIDIQLIAYVKTTHQYFNPYGVGELDGQDGWGNTPDSKATDDYFWVDVRNTGNRIAHNLVIHISFEPDDWEIFEIDAVGERTDNDVKCTFNKETMTIRTLYPQYDSNSGKHYDERYTTCMLRFRVSTGIKGGYDYFPYDGYPDAVFSNDEVGENQIVGYWPGEYNFIFNVGNDKEIERSIKLYTIIQNDGDIQNNYLKPYDSRSFIPISNRPKDELSNRPGSVIFQDYSYAIIVIIIAFVVLVLIWGLKLYTFRPKRKG